MFKNDDCIFCGDDLCMGDCEYESDQPLIDEIESFNCTCGAYEVTEKGIIHLFDCLCGYG